MYKKIIESGTYWYQSRTEIEQLEDDKSYKCIFINFSDAGHRKK